ncbi:unnamed protein product [Linum trigynum]|uniref:non-specific serine/threonine protein kinase n=1 Tax=Linum trigynum TaxID=586398 RepID=A0AAV2EKZ8_9ROSI
MAMNRMMMIWYLAFSSRTKVQRHYLQWILATGKDTPCFRSAPYQLSASRWRISLGSGLAYLHEDCDPKILHRDIKAVDILLDHNFEAKCLDLEVFPELIVFTSSFSIVEGGDDRRTKI